MLSNLDFLKTLFNHDESACFATHRTDTAAAKVCGVHPLESKYEFVTINPLETRRLDKNVTSLRNFLVEIDVMPLDEQERFIAQIGMPYSTKVFSGNKSYHFVICLREAVASKSEYKALAKRILKAAYPADASTKNPSRFTRFPNHIRSETKETQALVEVRNRIDISELESWLVARGQPKKVPPVKKATAIPNSSYPVIGNSRVIGPQAKNLRMFGAANGGRNNALFFASLETRNNGFSLEETTQILEPAFVHLESDDFSRSEFDRTIKSAFQLGPNDE
jgi:hypothetical protein